jgi:DNA-directed RNA polymerase subunit RPC12/RpoP
MIIICAKCHKKFDVNSELIPETGRLLQCSSCSYKWFFKKTVDKDTKDTKKTDFIRQVKESSNKETLENFPINQDDEINTDNDLKIKNNEKLKDKINSNKNKHKKNNILNIILVFFISFGALIILLDTFKGPLNEVIPNTEFLLYNLYESFKDLVLFFSDLI